MKENKDEYKQKAYVPDISGFLKPFGINMTIYDILNSDIERLKVFYYERDDIRKPATLKQKV